MLDSLILWVAENGMRDTAYSIWGPVGTVIVVTFGLWYRWKINLKIHKAIICLLYFIYLQTYVMWVVMWANSGFTEWGEANVAVAYVYIPLVALLLSKILKEPYNKISDFMAFPGMIYYGIGRWGCVFYGCCYGYPCSWGIYNPFYEDYKFPVQILESVVAFSVVGLLLYLSKKRNYVFNGELLPTFLTVYGAARFLIEFLHDNDKVLLGCSKIAFHALFMCIVGAILWTVKRKQNKMINQQ